jgi:transcriptional regulator with XRE-family HTH domain
VSHESPKPEDRLVGHVLRTFRERQGLSQEEAAHVTGLHRAQYGRYEAGQNAPSFLTVVQIARKLGVPAAEFAAEAERQLAALE